VGGIQSYLWELWRRLPSDDVAVLTSPHPAASEWDAEQDFRVERVREPVLLPHPGLLRHIRRLADDHGAELVLIDPALPLGALAPFVGRPTGLVLHGAEVTVPGRIPVANVALREVLRRTDLVVAAGGYPLAEAGRAAGRRLRSVVVPPGVDVDRFTPLSDDRIREVRSRFGLPLDGALVVSVSRLVPRKGMDVTIKAVAALAADGMDVTLAIAGGGRDEGRLRRLAEALDAPVHFLGRVDDGDLPLVYGCGDVFAMLCRSRWAGLEQEGFGIVFLEAAATGVPQVAGRSGGSHEAVEDGETGFVVDDPTDVVAVADRIGQLVEDAGLRRKMGAAARQRCVELFSYDRLSGHLHDALDAVPRGG
jgi:phosphatidylinositol alpha-1,6-mannosyltransferase